MNTPAFQQLTGLLDHVKTGLRAHSYLVTDLGNTADQICQLALPYQVFKSHRDGVGFYLDVTKGNLPVISIYPEDFEDGEGGQIGNAGLEVSFGIQYLFPYRAPGTDYAAEAKAVLFSSAVIWAVRELLDNPASVCAASYIEGVTADSFTLLPPIGSPVRGFEGKGHMVFSVAPWQAGPDTVPLEAIWANTITVVPGNPEIPSEDTQSADFIQYEVPKS